jgi:hypothetical protein
MLSIRVVFMFACRYFFCSWNGALSIGATDPLGASSALVSSEYLQIQCLHQISAFTSSDPLKLGVSQLVEGCLAQENECSRHGVLARFQSENLKGNRLPRVGI